MLAASMLVALTLFIHIFAAIIIICHHRHRVSIRWITFTAAGSPWAVSRLFL